MTLLFLLLYLISIFIAFALFEWYEVDDYFAMNMFLATIWPIYLVAVIIFAPFYLIHEKIQERKESNDSK